MKSWALLILCVISAGPAFGQKLAKKPPFTIVLIPEKATANLVSDIFIKILWTNDSNETVDASANILDATNLDPNFILDMRDMAKHLVPTKVYRFPQTSGHAAFGALKPNESMTNEVNLRKLYNLDRPGKYTLRVSRRVPKSLGGGIVKSNIITITLTDKPEDIAPKH